MDADLARLFLSASVLPATAGVSLSRHRFASPPPVGAVAEWPARSDGEHQ